jgi:sulfur-carrier protein adenylyltransferase/sulfurtransferase
MKEITVEELQQMRTNGEDFQLIDVRENDEAEIVSIGGELIPMGDIMDNIDKISKDKKVVLHCKGGGRSGAVVQALEQKGYNNVYNLKGGIIAYINQVDPNLPKY